jgi:hypothetical protein
MPCLRANSSAGTCPGDERHTGACSAPLDVTMATSQPHAISIVAPYDACPDPRSRVDMPGTRTSTVDGGVTEFAAGKPEEAYGYAPPRRSGGQTISGSSLMAALAGARHPGRGGGGTVPPATQEAR